MAMMGKIISGTNNRYVIYCDGSVENVATGRIIKPQLHSKGYLQVVLYVGGLPRKHFIHRLLGIYYIDNPKKLPTINHIDGNKLNNSLSNLEWCSYSRNNKHAYENGLKRSNAKKICMYTKFGDLLRVFNSTVSAQNYLRDKGWPKANNGNIGACANGKRKTAYKRIWRWLE